MPTETNPHSSRKLITAELLSRGWKEASIMVGGRMFVRLTSPTGTEWMFPWAMVWYPFISGPAARTSVAKELAYAYVQSLGVTIPATLEVPATEQVTETFFSQYAPVIVKPEDGHGSHGVTLNISTLPALHAAVENSLSFSERALVQQQVTGDEIRFTVLNGQMVSALIRQTPRVVGDGKRSVAELLAAENVARESLRLPYLRYPQLDTTMVAAETFSDQRVPTKGEILELNKSTLIRGGASVYNITDEVDESYKQTVLKLARNLNPDFLVIDMMLQDYKSPQTDTNYAFIEFNTAPALKMYYSARDGKQYDIVPKLADLIEARMNQ